MAALGGSRKTEPYRPGAEGAQRSKRKESIDTAKHTLAAPRPAYSERDTSAAGTAPLTPEDEPRQ